ncbi:hypothetical protein Tco_0339810 [Tanacetum coccineum]
MTSSKNVYSRKRIIAVTKLSIMKKYDYGHLEEIEVRREDQQLYKFREGMRMKYLPKRKWSNLDKRRARVMGGNVSDNGDDYDDDEDNDANDDDSDEKRTESDRDENPNLNQSDEEYEEEDEEYVDERVHTPPDYQLTYEEKDDDEEKMDEEDDDEVTKELYKDVNMNLGNRDADMTDADHGGADQQNTDGTMQSSSVSSDFTRKLLNLENPSPFDNGIASLMDTTVHHEEQGNRYINNKLREAINKAIQAHNLDSRQEAHDEKDEYIALADTSMRTIIKEEVTTQLPQILPQAVSDFATLVTRKNVT